MNSITRTKQNIAKIEDFAKCLKSNFKYHARIAKTSQSIDEIENSLACLKDYAQIAQTLVEAIDDYNKKVYGE